MRRRIPARTTATLVAAISLGLAAPVPAFADAPDNPWTRWAAQVLDRPTKAEIPLAVIASVPAMLVITPIWLGQLALSKFESEEDD